MHISRHLRRESFGLSVEILEDRRLLAHTPTDDLSEGDILPLNHAPSAVNLSQSIQYVEDRGPVAVEDIVVEDPDPDEFVSLTISMEPGDAGVLRRADGRLLDGSGVSRLEGTVEELNAQLAGLAFVPAENRDQDTTLLVQLTDGGEDDVLPLEGLIEFHVSPVEDRPFVKLEFFDLPSIDVTREVVSLKISDRFVTRVGDPDTGDQTGIAILSVSDLATWEYSTDGGQTYRSITDVSVENALLLSDDDWIRYTADLKASRHDMSIRAWDPVPGQSGTFVDTTDPANATALSEGTAGGFFFVREPNFEPTAININQHIPYPEDAEQVPMEPIIVSDENRGDDIFVTITLEEESGSLFFGGPHLKYRLQSVTKRGRREWTYYASDAGVNQFFSDIRFLPEPETNRPATIEVSISNHHYHSGEVVSGVIQLEPEPENDAPVLGPLPGQFVRGESFPVDVTPTFPFNVVDSATTLGDIDGDGVSDVAIGGQKERRTGFEQVSVFSGRTRSLLYTLDIGSHSSMYGAVVRGLGDLSGDDVPDFVVGAPLHHANESGAVWIYSGADGSVLGMLNGIRDRERFGTLISHLGDVNGDGAADFSVSSNLDAVVLTEVRLYSGSDFELLTSYSGTTEAPVVYVRAAGDVNGDGYGDVIVNSMLVSGFDMNEIKLFDRGDLPERSALAAAGDVNADGFDDLLVLKPERETQLVVASGRDGSRIYPIRHPNRGGFTASDVALRRLTTAGDIDADGHDDIVVVLGRMPHILMVFSGKTGRLVAHTEAGRYNSSIRIPAIGDLSGDGIADILLGNRVYTVDTPTVAPFPVRANVGVAVGNLISDHISDVDPDAKAGAGVIAVSGVWEYSTDDGQTYREFGQIDEQHALLLDLADRIRFSGLPDTDQLSVTLVAWDQTEGNPGDYADVTVRGGTSPFSLDTMTFPGRFNHPLTAANLDSVIHYTEGMPRVSLPPIVVSDPNQDEIVTVRLELPSAHGTVRSLSSSRGVILSEGGIWEMTGTVSEVNVALSNTIVLLDSQAPSPLEVSVEIFENALDGYDLNGSVTLLAEPENDAPRLRDPRVEFALSPPLQEFRPSVFVRALALINDFDGDGQRDYLVEGSSHAGPGIVSGRDGRLVDFVPRLPAPDRTVGRSARSAGDIDGDGVLDFMVGAPDDRDDGGGTALVYSGADGTILHQLTTGAANDSFGWSLSGVGDLNGDGHDEFIVGAPDDDTMGTNSGRVRVYSGVDGSELYVLDGPNEGAKFGWSVLGTADLNGDGRPDFLVGAPQDVESAAIGSVLAYSGADGTPLYSLHGNWPGDQFGTSLADVGDLDLDGTPDFIVGASRGSYAFGQRVGTATVYSGADGTEIYHFHGDASGDEFGASVAGLGDVNGDGHADIAVGSPGTRINGENSGSVLVYSGADGRLLTSIAGNRRNDLVGMNIASAGDLNRDGLGAVFVGGRWLLLRSQIFEPVKLPAEFEVKRVNEDLATPDYSVRRLVPDWFDDEDSDSLFGIAVRRVTGNGRWEYSIDGGRSFNVISDTSIAQALLLRGSDFVRYIPDGQNAEQARLTFVAWDQTTGEAGQRVDTSRTGGRSSFSADEVTALQTVRAVNDPPELNGPDRVSTRDDMSVRPLAEVTVTDVDQPSQVLQVTVQLERTDLGSFSETTLAAGNFEIDIDGQFVVSGTASVVSHAIQQLEFVPAENVLPIEVQAAVPLLITVDDGNGGIAALSSSIEITSIVDSPTLVFGRTLAVSGARAIRLSEASLAVNDDDADERLELTLRFSHGVIDMLGSEMSNDADHNVQVQGLGTSQVEAVGTDEDLNATLSTFSLVPFQGFEGPALVQATVIDRTGTIVSGGMTIVFTSSQDGFLTRDDAVVVIGSDAPNTFSVVADGDTVQIELNGEVRPFDADQVASIYFVGRNVDDSATIHGSPAVETIELEPGYARVVNASLAVEAIDVRHVIVHAAAGDDRAILLDSDSDDRLEASSFEVRLSSSDFVNQVFGVESVQVAASLGDDRAELFDSPGDDMFCAAPTSASMSGHGYEIVTTGFDRVTAEATGGDDRAYLYDSEGNDYFKGTPDFARLSGVGYYNRAVGFDRVSAFSSQGKDRAYLDDSPANDYFVANPGYARLSGPGYFNGVEGFDRVYATASLGGSDRAILEGSDGDDRFTTDSEMGRLVGQSYLLQATGFGGISAFGQGGRDRTVLTGDQTKLTDFMGHGDTSLLWGPSTRRTANGFEEVRASANQVVIQLVFADDELLELTDDLYTIESDEFYTTVHNFGELEIRDVDGSLLLYSDRRRFRH